MGKWRIVEKKWRIVGKSAGLLGKVEDCTIVQKFKNMMKIQIPLKRCFSKPGKSSERVLGVKNKFSWGSPPTEPRGGVVPRSNHLKKDGIDSPDHADQKRLLGSWMDCRKKWIIR